MATKVKKEVEISAKDLASKTLESLTYKFKKFEGALKSVQNAAGNVARSARGIITTFGGAATAAVAAINKMATQADDLNTMANVVGLNIEAYQKLRYAAEQNDVSVESFDKSLQVLSKTMGELRNNTGTLYSRLNKTNPALLKQLRAAKDNESAFRLMMQAINKASTAQQKAYLATAAFGKSGQVLISLGNAGADAIARFEKEAEQFGLVSSQGGTAADEWGRAVVRVRKALEGVGFTIMNKVLPQLIPTVNKISEWIAQNKELIATRVVEWGNKLFNVLKSISVVMGPLIHLFSEYSGLVYILFGAKLAGLVANIVKFIVALINLTKAIKALNIVQGIWNVLCAVNPAVWLTAAVLGLSVAIVALIKHWKDIVNWFQKLIDKYPLLKKLFDYIKTVGKSIADIFKTIWKFISDIIVAAKWAVDKFSGLFGGNKTLTVEQQAAADDTLREMNILPKYSPVNSSGLQMSPLADSQIQIATSGGIRQSADINVRFDNTPPMTRIDTVSRDTNLDLEIYRGANGGTIQ